MQDIDLSKIKNIHFIGIGGIGISAVARMMLHARKTVTGQDMQEGEVIEELRKLGIYIIAGQSYDYIPVQTELIVYTIALDTYDPELASRIKKQTKIPVLSYPQMLDIISRDKYTIAVAGTHGKTTTTAMIAKILCDTNNDPTVIVGSLLTVKNAQGEKIKSNFIAGKSKYLVVEACEYRRSFLNINPKILVITNIDNDHLDYYKDVKDIQNAFREMVMKVPSDGFVVCNPNDENIIDVVRDIPAKIINWGDYFDHDLKLKIPGTHNKKDAAAAIASSLAIGIPVLSSKKALLEFTGTWKRFEFRGNLINGVILYDDYAHHPTEIIATLEGFRELYPKTEGWKVTVVFQPHLFSRTKLLLNDFAKSFKDADEVLVLPIYFAREENDESISSTILSEEISKISNNVKSFLDFKEAEEYIKDKLSNMGEKDIIVTMGAGEASKVGDFLLKI